MNIAFIGGGNMAAALIGGLLRQGFAANAITVVEIDPAGRERLGRAHGVRAIAAPDASLAATEVIVLAVKPQDMKDATASLAPHLGRQLVLSIAAGIRLTDLRRWLGGHEQLVRSMPNTPALIGQGITALYAAAAVTVEQRAAAEFIAAAVGKTVWVDDEALIDPVTALSGSGPAYVFYFLEALQAGGHALGLADETARQLALQTFVGAAELAAISPETFATLRERVTSKGGTTAAALAVMNEHGIAQSIGAALKAASERGREMGETMGKD